MLTSLSKDASIYGEILHVEAVDNVEINLHAQPRCLNPNFSHDRCGDGPSPQHEHHQSWHQEIGVVRAYFIKSLELAVVDGADFGFYSVPSRRGAPDRYLAPERPLHAFLVTMHSPISRPRPKCCHLPRSGLLFYFHLFPVYGLRHQAVQNSSLRRKD